MAYLNRSFIMGNLVRNPELRYTQQGSPVCEMTIAVNRKANGKESVCYIDVIVWGKAGENCSKYLGKGSSALVEGYFQQDTWDDRNTGQRRTKLKLVAENVQFISTPRSTDQPEPSEPDTQQPGRYSGNDHPEPQPNPQEPQPRFYGDTGSKPAPSGEQPQIPQADAEDDIPF